VPSESSPQHSTSSVDWWSHECTVPTEHKVSLSSVALAAAAVAALSSRGASMGVYSCHGKALLLSAARGPSFKPCRIVLRVRVMKASVHTRQTNSPHHRCPPLSTHSHVRAALTRPLTCAVFGDTDKAVPLLISEVLQILEQRKADEAAGGTDVSRCKCALPH
jgi:hypothetical protein